MKLRFDSFEVDTAEFQLLSDGAVQSVEPKVFDLIAFLAAHPNQVFSREDLIDSVWKGRIVSDATVATCVKNARKALGDTGDHQKFVQTVRGRGYRFNGDVKEHHPKVKEVVGTATQEGLADADPSIMILPLQCFSENLEIQRLATEVSSNIGRIMSRVPLLRFSTEANAYRDSSSPPTARTLYEECGVDLVLDGSIRESGTQARVVLQLANARTGFQVWTESFDIAQPFYDHLDALVSEAIGKLEPQVHKAMYSLVRATSAAPNARGLFLEASGLLVMRGWSHDSFDAANEILKQSAALDPDFALTHALQALLYGFSSRIGLSIEVEQARQQARDSAELAIELDNMDSTVMGLAGCSLADIGDLQRGEHLLRNAIDLNPANAQAWVALGAVRLVQLDPEEAISLLTKGMEISPRDSRLSIWGAFLSVAHLLNQNVSQACDEAELACRRHDKTYLPRIALAAAQLIRGDAQAAALALQDARRIKPDLSDYQVGALVGRELAERLLSLED